MRSQAVFLDLQGTLGGQGLGDVMEFAFYPTSAPAIRIINDAGLLAIVVTNQSHIARGRFTMADFQSRMAELTAELFAEGARLDGVYCCPHSEQDSCGCRKPQPGLVHQAARDFALDLTRCYVVGDTGAWDVVLARSAGCKAVLVRTGLGESSLGEYRHTWQGIEPDHVARDVLDAATWVVRDTRTI